MSPSVTSGASEVAHAVAPPVPFAQTPPCVANHCRLAPGNMSVTGFTQAVAPWYLTWDCGNAKGNAKYTPSLFRVATLSTSFEISIR